MATVSQDKVGFLVVFKNAYTCIKLHINLSAALLHMLLVSAGFFRSGDSSEKITIVQNSTIHFYSGWYDQ